MPYNPSACVLITIASIRGLWPSALDFQGFNGGIGTLKLILSFQRKSLGKIPKEDFFSYNAKFSSRGGEDWLLLGAMSSEFLRKGLQGTLQRGICLKTQVSKYKLTAS
jgi:hypothetical protein